MLFGILGWLVVGLMVGFIANKLVNLRNDDPGLGMIVGVVSAALGGWLYGLIAGSPITGFNPWSLLFAAVGAAVGLFIWHGWRARTFRA